MKFCLIPPYWVMVNRALLGNEPTMSFNLWAKVNSLMSYTPNLKPCFTSLFLITGQCRLIFKYAALHNYWMVPWVIFIPYINIPHIYQHCGFFVSCSECTNHRESRNGDYRDSMLSYRIHSNYACQMYRPSFFGSNR